ncbi:hypothetical protein [Chondromyces crocatus]|uniref:Uncharacterized protein n=1 Tax=Chondromyces crocatus TaxID=52 RepID=A0A0K1EF35_CHOCO|nr:hypothetical protein [Chondromyces crocatus]AKT39464.1 uncharacterized protein CMC5_036110 [Chondromyces crocatus]
MKNHPVVDRVTFEAPHAGPWELERVVFTRPLTRFIQESVTKALPRGLADGTARYGMLLSHVQLAAVNGFVYFRPVLHGMQPEVSWPPTGMFLWLMLRLQPSLRARMQTCRRAFETKRWRAELSLWDRVDRPLSIARNQALQAEDPAALDTDGLITHLSWARAHLEDMIEMHHRYDLAACLPMGDYLAHACAWTGASPEEALAALGEGSPGMGAVAPGELDALVRVIEGCAEAQAWMNAGRIGSDGHAGSQGRAGRDGRAGHAGHAGRDGHAGRARRAGSEERARSDGGGSNDEGEDGKAWRILEGLASLSGEAGEAARRLLEGARFRSVGFDVCEATGGEQPGRLVRAIQEALSALRNPETAGERLGRERALRERVPAEFRAQFDALLGEARGMSRLRLERGVYADQWAVGLARRALLEAGGRLVATGALVKAEHAVELSVEELGALLQGRGGLSASEVEARFRWRAEASFEVAPAWLNMPLLPMPSDTSLPPCAQRLARATQALGCTASVAREYGIPGMGRLGIEEAAPACSREVRRSKPLGAMSAMV